MRALDGKVALITGSSRGIGAAIAQRFAAEGARVAIHGRDAAALDAVRQTIRADGGAVACVTGDVTKQDDVERMRLDVERELGEVDVLVVNAGAASRGPVRSRISPSKAGARPWTAT